MYSKYIEALRLMDLVIAVKDAVPPEGEKWARWETPKGPGHHIAPVQPAWDECFTYIHANFAVPETGKNGFTPEQYQQEVALCRPLIDGTYPSCGPEMEAVMRGIPPVLLDVVWPVGIARFLLRDCRVPFNHRLSTTFSEFHKRYGRMILAD